MIPKFANPYSLTQDIQTTTRAEIAEQTAIATSVVYNEETDSLKRSLDDLLRDTWTDSLAQSSNPKKSQKRRRVAEPHGNVGDRHAFRLLSSMKQPQLISLEPKPSSLPQTKTREPDCEDDPAQAEERRRRALSVAVDIGNLGQLTPSTARPNRKNKIVEAKLPLTTISRSLPSLLVIEEGRRAKAQIPNLQRIKTLAAQDLQSPAASPHEPQISLSCFLLPVTSAPNWPATPRGKRRKPVKERPPPAYWKPSSEVRGKCMGYALGYPCSWASSGSISSDRPYQRDGMKKGVYLTPS